jgi:hypothetical protein
VDPSQGAQAASAGAGRPSKIDYLFKFPAVEEGRSGLDLGGADAVRELNSYLQEVGEGGVVEVALEPYVAWRPIQYAHD